MNLPSTRPYLIRALHEWCCDHGFTPYISVVADEWARVPREFVRDGQIVLNINYEATNRLKIGNEEISFQARFGGVPRDILIPIGNVVAIYAKENGTGMGFEYEKEGEGEGGKEKPAEQPRGEATETTGHGRNVRNDGDGGDDDRPPPSSGRPRLQRVK